MPRRRNIVSYSFGWTTDGAFVTISVESLAGEIKDNNFDWSVDIVHHDKDQLWRSTYVLQNAPNNMLALLALIKADNTDLKTEPPRVVPDQDNQDYIKTVRGLTRE